MAKVAVQISGMQRYGRYFGEFQSMLASRFGECDFFIHHWHGIRNENAVRDLIVGHKVQAIKMEPQIRFEVRPEWRSNMCTPFNVISMLYGIQQASNLRLAHEAETGTSYDLVFRARSDIKLDEFPEDPAWALDLPFRTIRVGKRPHYLPHYLMEVQDQVAFGRPEDMNVYGRMYEGLDMPFTPLVAGSKPKLHPETYVCWWLKTHGMGIDESMFSTRLERDHIPRELRAIY